MTNWHILDIVIYGDEEQIRTIELTPGVNIITGDSQSGKSAVIPIVDYCLGSTKCEIPVGPIREFATWYGLRLQAGEEQIFVARRDPNAHNSTNVMHIIVGKEVPIPTREMLTGNTERSAVVSELSRRIGFPEVSLAESSYDTVFTESPSIRSSAFFLFQPQNVIANKDVLFYKTSQKDYLQRLERVFPFVLGAVDIDYFKLRGEVERQQKTVNSLSRRVERERALSGTNDSMSNTLLAQASDLGLIESVDEITNMSDRREALLKLISTTRPFRNRTSAVQGDPIRREALEAESRQIRSQIAIIRNQIADVESLSRDVNSANNALEHQAGRLRAVDIWTDNEHSTSCPVCSQPVGQVLPTVNQLTAIKDEIRAEISGLSAAPEALTEARKTLHSELDGLRNRLKDTDSNLAALYQIRPEPEPMKNTWAAQERLLGAIRFFLDQWPSETTTTPDLEHELAIAESKLNELRSQLSEFDLSDRKQAVLNAIAGRMLVYSQRLKTERPGATLWLDIKNMTVVRESPSGAPERLGQIGGGENHIGYHLCALFALHWFFMERKRPVPSFLFIDQPSQVYFPEQEAVSSNSSVAEPRTDWDAVWRLYRMMFDTVRELDNRLQVIILDHANFKDDEFQNAIRRRWRNGHKLI